MANNVVFQIRSAKPLQFTHDEPCITNELTLSTVESITVQGDAWVFFEAPNYGGNIVVYKAGQNKPFPNVLKSIKSARVIKGGISSSKVTFYPHPFFKGKAESFEKKTPQLLSTYLSLKVDEGAMVFFSDENYEGETSILLNGDEVQNYTAVKLTSIGKSVKTAWDIVT